MGQKVQSERGGGFALTFHCSPGALCLPQILHTVVTSDSGSGGGASHGHNHANHAVLPHMPTLPMATDGHVNQPLQLRDYRSPHLPMVRSIGQQMQHYGLQIRDEALCHNAGWQVQDCKNGHGLRCHWLYWLVSQSVSFVSDSDLDKVVGCCVRRW